MEITLTLFSTFGFGSILGGMFVLMFCGAVFFYRRMEMATFVAFAFLSFLYVVLEILLFVLLPDGLPFPFLGGAVTGMVVVGTLAYLIHRYRVSLQQRNRSTEDKK